MKKLIAIAAAFVLSVSMLSGCAEKGGDAKFIGTDAAKQIALKNAGISESEASQIEVELDRESTYSVYDVSFEAVGYEFEYDIDAYTGEIVKNRREIDDDSRLPAVTESDRTPFSESVPTDTPPDESEPVSTEPEVSEPVATEPAATEPTPDTTPAPETAATPTPTENEYIGRDKAIENALKHAGLSKSDVYDLEAELDRERGVTVYDVSFDADGYDYDYEIDAKTGDVLRSDKERDGDYRKYESSVAENTEYIGRDKAKNIALDHAGLKESEVRDLDIEFDYDRGSYIYEVNFDCGGYEYDYDIDAVTGNIKNNKKERD